MEVQSEYGASNYIVKSCQGEGNPATPYPKLGHPLAPKNTCDFYESDDVSRMMGGKLHVKQAEQHVYDQRRLILSKTDRSIPTIQGQISKGNHWVL